MRYDVQHVKPMWKSLYMNLARRPLGYEYERWQGPIGDILGDPGADSLVTRKSKRFSFVQTWPLRLPNPTICPWVSEDGLGINWTSSRKPFSSPEPTILLACGRNRELWEQPLCKNKGNNRILVIRLTAHPHLWRMPEMVTPRALDSCGRPEGS